MNAAELDATWAQVHEDQRALFAGLAPGPLDEYNAELRARSIPVHWHLAVYCDQFLAIARCDAPCCAFRFTPAIMRLAAHYWPRCLGEPWIVQAACDDPSHVNRAHNDTTKWVHEMRGAQLAAMVEVYMHGGGPRDITSDIERGLAINPYLRRDAAEMLYVRGRCLEQLMHNPFLPDRRNDIRYGNKISRVYAHICEHLLHDLVRIVLDHMYEKGPILMQPPIVWNGVGMFRYST